MNPVLLIRHGEADHHIQAITGGWTDTELTDLGRFQAELLAKRLNQELAGIPLLLATSRLRRASDTAEVIGRDLGIRPIILPELVDLNNGIAAGKTHAEARAVALEPNGSLLDWQPYPEAESWRQFFQRITGFMESINGAHDGAVMLVTHAANIHGIVSWWLGIPVETQAHFDVAPASLTVLTINRWQVRTLERLNDCSHLYAAGLRQPLPY